jgi:predicted small integral membrane protein
MYSTPFLLRLAKIISVTGIGLFGFLITFNNITDYYTNYFFVAHVMEMDSVFPDSNVHYRAIHSPSLFHAG